MASQRGEVVLIPFPYTDLTAAKTRPAVVVSGPAYHAVRSEHLLAYVSSQIAQVTPPVDYLLKDWKQAGLLKPSFVRPKIVAIEPHLIVQQVGRLSARDIGELDRKLRLAMALTANAFVDIVTEIDFLQRPPSVLQAVAEKSVTALVTLAANGNSIIDINRIRKLI